MRHGTSRAFARALTDPTGAKPQRRAAWMHMLMRALGAIVMIFSASTPGYAQRRSIPDLQIGSRIRIQLKQMPARRTGVIEDVDTLNAMFTFRDSSGVGTFERADVRTLDLSGGRRRSGEGAMRGAFTGLKVGVVLGSILVAATYLSNADESCGDCIINATPAAIVVAVSFTALSTVFGTLIGAASPGERWLPILP